MDVAADDQLRAGVDERREHVVAARDRLLPRAPRRADHLVVERDDAQRARRRLARAARRRALELRVADAARLVAPRPDRVEADDVRPRRRVDGLGRLPLPLELAPGAREARREGVRDVVVPGHREHGGAEARGGSRRRARAGRAGRGASGRRSRSRAPASTRSTRRAERPLQDRVVPGAEMEVGDVEDASNHRRSRLYSECHGRRAVDRDLRRPLPRPPRRRRAAQAAPRRGADREEREALGRWQRLSPWRKGIAIGGFAVGTFGLGFTLGGLVFGRWRKA